MVALLVKNHISSIFFVIFNLQNSQHVKSEEAHCLDEGSTDDDDDYYWLRRPKNIITVQIETQMAVVKYVVQSIRCQKRENEHHGGIFT